MENEKPDPLQLRPVSMTEALRARVGGKLQFHPREVVALIVLAALVLIGAGLAYVRSRPAAASTLAPVVVPATPSPTPTGIFVHVVGAVRAPGVFSFVAGDRVVDAVRAAGGFARGADTAGINLARTLVDGEQIYVPRRGEVPPSGAPSGGGSGQQGGKVNINLATAAELESLPGIGPALSQRIIEYREQHGPFKAITDLQKVSGIGPKKFASLEPLITV